MAQCKKCGYVWATRTSNDPKACPNCKTRKWNATPKPACVYCAACPTCHPAATPELMPSRRRPTPDAQTALDRFKEIEVPDGDVEILAALGVNR